MGSEPAPTVWLRCVSHLHDGGVSRENGLGVDHPVLFGRGVDVPQADSVVVGGAEEVPVQVGVPGQAVAFFLVAAEPVKRIGERRFRFGKSVTKQRRSLF